eukprot:gene29809-33650_t
MQALQPVEDWGRDPLFSGFRKLLIVTIRIQVKKVLANELFLFYLCGRGISKVEIVGWIMSVQIRPKKVIYYIDDGTAPCMRCTKFLSSVDPLSHTSYKPGDIVS